MSNVVKWTDSDTEPPGPVAGTGMRRSPWTTFLGSLVGLAVLAAALPGPASWASTLAGAPIEVGTGTGADSAAETALLVAAGAIVWSLLGWGVLVSGVAILGRLPGAPGHLGRVILRRIAPAAAGRLVVATLGVSLLAGTTACAAPALAGSDVTAASTAIPSNSTAATTPTPTTSGSVQDVPSIDIDWPMVVASAPTPAQSVTAAPGATTTSTDVASPPTPTPGSDQSGPGSTDAATVTSSTTPVPGDPADPPPATTPSGESVPPADTDAPEQPAPTTGDQGAAAPAGNDADPVTSTTGSAAAMSTGAVIVQPGDSLWSIAAATLPASASASDIDSVWRAWYLTNRQLIGDDPDRIEPGQSLLPPTTDLEPSP